MASRDLGAPLSSSTNFSGFVVYQDLETVWWQNCESVFIFNLNQFNRQIIRVFIPMRPLRGGPQHKRRLLPFLLLKLARVEENFSVRVSVDYVANLLDIKRTWPTMRMDWLFAVWCDCYF
jgi:hypothetical protein